MNNTNLTPEEEKVIIHKGTEAPFSGIYTKFTQKGIYCCKKCNAGLYFSDYKFESSCGWPSFDESIAGTVKRIPDADGIRTEIVCTRCGAHLGHVFEGEGFTKKDTRYCVNSISLNFVPEEQLDTAYFASGCFWGTQYYFSKEKGVLATLSGFMGGSLDNPTYEEVYTDTTGHAEVVKVVYDTTKVSYEDLVKLFFETHDFTQVNRQGPDVGKRYRTALFVNSDKQKQIAEKYIHILTQKGYNVATKLEPQSSFWEAELRHQNYYDKKGGMPYCHIYKKIF